jgi:hypothetical protein
MPYIHNQARHRHRLRNPKPVVEDDVFRLVGLMLHIHNLRASIQLTRKRPSLMRMLITRVVLRIRRLGRRTHTRAWRIIHWLSWACMAALLRILVTIHGQRARGRRLADGRLRLRSPCVLFAISNTERSHAGTLLLHRRRIVLWWGVRTRWCCRLRVVGCCWWCGSSFLGLLLADAEPGEETNKCDTQEWADDDTGDPCFA